MAVVEANNELAESMVGNLLEEVGIKGRSRQKQHDVRKLLVDKALLFKQKNYFSDPDTGYRHGNFYICGPGVRFEEKAIPHTPHTVSICYLSLEVTPVDQVEGFVLNRGKPQVLQIAVVRQDPSRWSGELPPVSASGIPFLKQTLVK